MTALVEVHDEADLARALACRPALIGINNRDLRTFEVSLDTTRRMAPAIPSEIAVVAESGIFTPQHARDLAALRRADGAPAVDAILVGEALVTALDHARPRQRTRNRRSKAGYRMIVKVCGITTLDDGLAALDAGAEMLGFNFYPPSPRYLTTAACTELVSALRGAGPQFSAVGVFVNENPAEIRRMMSICDLDLAQLSGDEPPGDLAAVGEGRAFKSIRARGAVAISEADRYAVQPGALRPALLLDAAAGTGQYGGTGLSADRQAAAHLAATHALLLAGGLRPDNVAEAVRQVRPWGVDVASGVESAPGRKDPDPDARLHRRGPQCRAGRRINDTGSTVSNSHTLESRL